MAGKYVTSVRRRDCVYTYLNRANKTNGNTSGVLPRPYVRYQDMIGNWLVVNPSITTDFFPLQTTYSYRSIGSPLGPKQSEWAEIMSRPSGPLSSYSRYDTGHLFTTAQEQIHTSHPSFSKKFSNGFEFSGPLLVRTESDPANNFGLPALPAFDSSYYGKRLLAAAVPTVPQTNLLTTAAEILREGISIPGRNIIDALRNQTGLLRGAGSEYLNAQFGWLPLMSEFNKLLKSVVNASEMVANLERNSGRLVRRRRSMPISRTVTQSNLVHKTRLLLAGGSLLDSSNYHGLWQSVPDNTGQLASIVKQTSDEIWLSAQFAYYLDPGKDLKGKFARYGLLANHLLGLRLTPEVLWELTPWSWLVDYFVDLGSAFKLYSQFSNDSLVMRYGYLMRKTSQKVTVSATFPPFKDGQTIRVTTTREKVIKNRYRATPYGFGLDPNGFSVRQWAILAALGFSKAPRSLP